VTSRVLTVPSLPSDETLTAARAKPLALTVNSWSERTAPETQPVLPPAATSTEAATALPQLTNTESQESVLSQVEGIVLNDAGDSLLVRFGEQNLTIHFPRELISEELAQPGSAITYQIVRRANGIRYQRFVHRVVAIDRERVNQVTEMLGRIRLRGQ
jgi:hypothetical protein